MPIHHIVKITSEGRVSIPDGVLARWNADSVVVADLGDRVVLRPLPADPVGELNGKYRRRGPDTERARHQARVDEEDAR